MHILHSSKIKLKTWKLTEAKGKFTATEKMTDGDINITSHRQNLRRNKKQKHDEFSIKVALVLSFLTDSFQCVFSLQNNNIISLQPDKNEPEQEQ